MIENKRGVALNPAVTLDVVLNDGYSESDMRQYYHGTLLLGLKDDGTYDLVRCIEESRNTFIVEVLEEGRTASLPIERLFRFHVPIGFYQRGQHLLSYNYLQSRSYKKGYEASNAQFHRNGERINTNWRCIYEILFPEDRHDDKNFCISRRLAVRDGKLLTLHRYLSVGDYKDGDVSTPFACIRQRLEEMNHARA